MKLNKSYLISAAGLGAGAIGARVLGNKLLANQSAMVKPLPALLGGLLLSGKEGFVGNLGKGMVANGLADFVGSFIDKDGTLGIGGVDTVMMNGYVPGDQGSPMMGTDDVFSSYDYTAASSGEMDY